MDLALLIQVKKTRKVSLPGQLALVYSRLPVRSASTFQTILFPSSTIVPSQIYLPPLSFLSAIQRSRRVHN